jgi:glycosylphosphatidylinositol transamidase
LIQAFSVAGLRAGKTSAAVYASVTPPRSAGTETILISANWASRDGGLNLRGVATLLAMGDFLRGEQVSSLRNGAEAHAGNNRLIYLGQNHWAFNFVLVSGDSYLSGLSQFMESYHSLFSGVVWTALNIDYPGHSFSHLGVFYEGLNGRLPNQDIPNAIAHVGKWAGGVDVRLHNVEAEPPGWLGPWTAWLGESRADLRGMAGKYAVGARHLWEHARYMALGRASGAHGVMAK